MEERPGDAAVTMRELRDALIRLANNTGVTVEEMKKQLIEWARCRDMEDTEDGDG